MVAISMNPRGQARRPSRPGRRRRSSKRRRRCFAPPPHPRRNWAARRVGWRGRPTRRRSTMWPPASVTRLWSDPGLAEHGDATRQGAEPAPRGGGARWPGAGRRARCSASGGRSGGRRGARGFATGRMLREGCPIPAIGGGLGQLSNALYEVALASGCRILERHAHSPRARLGGCGGARCDGGLELCRPAVRAPHRWTAAQRPASSRRDSDRQSADERGCRQARRPLRPAAIVAPSHLTREFAANCATCDETDCPLHEDRGRRRHCLPAAGRSWLTSSGRSWPGYVAEARGP